LGKTLVQTATGVEEYTHTDFGADMKRKRDNIKDGRLIYWKIKFDKTGKTKLLSYPAFSGGGVLIMRH
jgi:hypothetical protein